MSTLLKKQSPFFCFLPSAPRPKSGFFFIFIDFSTSLVRNMGFRIPKLHKTFPPKKFCVFKLSIHFQQDLLSLHKREKRRRRKQRRLGGNRDNVLFCIPKISFLLAKHEWNHREAKHASCTTRSPLSHGCRRASSPKGGSQDSCAVSLILASPSGRGVTEGDGEG